MDHLFSRAQAARRVGVSARTIARQIKARRLRASRVGCQWRISIEDLEDYLRRTANDTDAGQGTMLDTKIMSAAVQLAKDAEDNPGLAPAYIIAAEKLRTLAVGA